MDIIFPCLLSHRTEKDKAPPSPHLTIHSNGLVRVQNDQMLVSTCRMHVYKFPFDVQSCNLSFKSVVHSGEFSLKHLKLDFLSRSFSCKLHLSLFTVSLCSGGNRAGSAPQFFGGQRDDDANPVRVAVCQHDGHQQNRRHVSSQTRRVDLYCESTWMHTSRRVYSCFWNTSIPPEKHYF